MMKQPAGKGGGSNPVMNSDISVTTVGQRKRRQNNNKQQHHDKMKETTVLVLNDLAVDSKFFQENPSRAVPVFNVSEIETGPELGRGEFGIVLEVHNILVNCANTATPTTTTDVDNNNHTNGVGTESVVPETSLYPPPPPSIVVFKHHQHNNHHNHHPYNVQQQLKQPQTTQEDEPELVDTHVESVLKTHRPAQSSVTFADLQIMEDIVVAEGEAGGMTSEFVAGDDDSLDSHPEGSFSSEDTARRDTDEDEEAETTQHETMNGDENDYEYSPRNTRSSNRKHSSMMSVTTAAQKMRSNIAARVLRDGEPRYALKRLKDKELLDPHIQVDAALDLACEARLLQSIKHSNIIRLRGIVGEPGMPSFGLLLDRLTCTLEQRITAWKEARHNGKLLDALFHRKQHKERQQMLFAERLLVALDIARALRHLHRKRILYRDLKPDNIGFNVRGDVEIFDFGLAKELKPRDLVHPPDGYEATGLTGSRRYMAPEVIRCLPYGFKADVYSYAIVFWQIFSLETPFPFDAHKHYELVVEKQRRPHRITHILPLALHRVMEDCWADEPTQRATLDQVCWQLQAEFKLVHGAIGGENEMSIMDRTMWLTDRSVTSMDGE